MKKKTSENLALLDFRDILDGWWSRGDRTPDLRNAIATLSQLSYGPRVPIETGLRWDAGRAFRRCFPGWKREKSHRPDASYPYLFVVVAGGDAQVVVAGAEIDLVVGARLLVLVGDQVLGAEIGVGTFLGLLGRRRFERHRLLRLQHRLGHEFIVAGDAVTGSSVPRS